MRKKLPIASTSSSSSSGGGSDELVKLMAMDGVGGDDEEVTGVKVKDEVLIECSIAQSIQLVQGFRDIPKFQEFAMEFVTNQVNHPVISCFRELNGADINFIITNMNKLKKRMVNLELGVTYLGLIDYLAFSVDNPFLAVKMNKIPTKVQKLMMEFKNIIGSWGLSDKEQFKNRYNLVMTYLRRLAPSFQTIGFSDLFGKILDAIEREVTKTKQNGEMIKALSHKIVVTSNDNNNPGVNGAMGSSPRKIELDISMDIDHNLMKMEDDDDNEISPHELKSNLHPVQTSIASFFTGSENSKQPRHGIGSPVRKLSFTGAERKRKADQKPTENKAKKVVCPALNDDSVPQLSATVSSQPSLPLEEISLISPTKAVEGRLSPRKKPRLDIDNENVENQVNPAVAADCSPVPKPKVDAFALLMNRSKQLSHQNKQPGKGKVTSNKSTLKSSVNNKS